MKLFLYENSNKLKEYYEDKLHQLMPKLDQFLDLGHKVQERYANTQKDLDDFEDEQIWKFVQEIINRENKFLERTEEIGQLKNSSIRDNRLYKKLDSLIKEFEEEIQESLVYASTIDVWFDNNGI